MNKFIKQVVNSVAVQAAVYAVTEGGKVIWPKAKEAFNKVVNKVESGVTLQTTNRDFKNTIKNTEEQLKERLSAAEKFNREKKKGTETPSKPEA